MLAINDTKRNDNIDSSLGSINSYSLERNERNSNGGGGVALYIKDNVNYKLRPDLTPSSLEMMVVEISKPKTKPFIISTWYRPPNSPIEVLREFENFLKSIDVVNKEILIVGDINCDLASTSIDPLRPTVQFLYDSYQFTQLINEYTRVTVWSKTMIDHLITNKPQTIIISGVLKISISDHYMIYGIRKFTHTKSNPKYIESRNMKNFDPNLFTQDLLNVQWNLYDNDDPNDMVYVWETLFLEVVNRHAPLCNRRVRNKPSPWLTPSIRKLMQNRDYLKKQSIKF